MQFFLVISWFLQKKRVVANERYDGHGLVSFTLDCHGSAAMVLAKWVDLQAHMWCAATTWGGVAGLEA